MRACMYVKWWMEMGSMQELFAIAPECFPTSVTV